MPIYCYKCDKCGKTAEFYVPMDQRNSVHPCDCKGGVLARNMTAELVHTDLPYQREVLSETMGINKNQIPRAKKLWPDSEWTPDGRMIVRSHQQRKRIMRERGMHDNDGYS